VTEKERTLLDKQKATLDPTSFDKLVRDFGFDVALQLPKPKAKPAKRGGKRGGRGGRGGRGRGRGGR
jgi:hypothetical protein